VAWRFRLVGLVFPVVPNVLLFLAELG